MGEQRLHVLRGAAASPDQNTLLAADSKASSSEESLNPAAEQQNLDITRAEAASQDLPEGPTIPAAKERSEVAETAGSPDVSSVPLRAEPSSSQPADSDRQDAADKVGS